MEINFNHLQLKDLPQIAAQVANALASNVYAQGFCIWLIGDLGAGKTTFVSHLLRAIGLAENQDVTSPTFTYVNEYLIDGRWYAHLDLYRLDANADVKRSD